MTTLKDAKYKSKSVFNLAENKRAKFELLKKNYEDDLEQLNGEHAIHLENLKKQARENEGKLRYEIKKLKEQNEDLVFEHKRQMAEVEMTHDEEMRRLKLHIEFVTTGSEKAVSGHHLEIDAIRQVHTKREEELRQETSRLRERLGKAKTEQEEAESLLKSEIFGIKTAKKEVEARHRQVIDDLWKENTTIAEKYQKQLDDVQREKERIERVFLAETGQLKDEWRELREELQKFKVKFDFSLPSPQPQQNTTHFPYPESMPTSYQSSETPSGYHSSQTLPLTPSGFHSSQTLPSNKYPSTQTLPTDYHSSQQNLPTTSFPPYATIKPYQEKSYPTSSSSSPSDVNYSTIDFDPSTMTSHLDKDGYEQPMPHLSHEKPTSRVNHEKPTSHRTQEKPTSHRTQEKTTSHRTSTDSSFSSHMSWASLDRNGFLRKSKNKKEASKKTRRKSLSNPTDDWL